LVFGIYSNVTAQRAKNLYNFVTSRDTVNVHIGEFSAADSDIDPKALITAIIGRLQERKSANFNIVTDIRDADLSINCNIEKFIYSKKDPIDIFLPVGLVVDVIVSKNYARLEYTINVLDTKKNKPSWKRRLKATIDESNMPKLKSIPLVLDRAAYVFIKECFGKPKGRHRI